MLQSTAVSLPTDSVPLLLTRAQAVVGPSTLTPEEQELLRRMLDGDVDATRQIAQRMAPRVQRVAAALMGSSQDAEDGAQHALIDVLRGYASYRGRPSFERWVDRAAAVSLLRFARAVRRRDAHAARAQLGTRAGALRGREARTFEQYLGLLPASSREVLLLRHGLGFPLGPLADALHVARPAVRELLLSARRELRELVQRHTAEPDTHTLGPGAQRWCALRDREALGDLLDVDEHAELATLEAREPEVWAFVAQIRALESYFEQPAKIGSESEEQPLVERAIQALQVTRPTGGAAAVDSEAELERAMEPAYSRAVSWIALSASVALALASVIALMLYEPQRPTPALEAALDGNSALRALPASASPRPTVEALSRARSATRGARLKLGPRLLAPGTPVSPSALVESGERVACLQLEPEAELCLPPWSALRVSSLAPQDRRFELVRGRVVVRISAGSSAVRLALGRLAASARAGVFGAEKTFDGALLRVRALRGEVALEAPELTRTLGEGQAALYRASTRALEVLPLPATFAQREWDVLTAGALPAEAQLSATRVATSSADGGARVASPARGSERASGEGAAPSSTEAPSRELPSDSPRELPELPAPASAKGLEPAAPTVEPPAADAASKRRTEELIDELLR